MHLTPIEIIIVRLEQAEATAQRIVVEHLFLRLDPRHRRQPIPLLLGLDLIFERPEVADDGQGELKRLLLDQERVHLRLLLDFLVDSVLELVQNGHFLGSFGHLDGLSLAHRYF